MFVRSLLSGISALAFIACLSGVSHAQTTTTAVPGAINQYHLLAETQQAADIQTERTYRELTNPTIAAGDQRSGFIDWRLPKGGARSNGARLLMARVAAPIKAGKNPTPRKSVGRLGRELPESAGPESRPLPVGSLARITSGSGAGSSAAPPKFSNIQSGGSSFNFRFQP